MKSLRTNLICTLPELLPTAQRKGYAVGAFSPRVAGLIKPVLLAGQHTLSPLIIQISQKELERYQLTPDEFANDFFQLLQQLSISVPVVLHLDHTRQFDIIKQAIAAGFSSVMIDASDQDLRNNIAITREVVAYAHAHQVSVEAELGRIGTTDFVETDQDEEYFTDPIEAQQFVQQTGVDALAISIGTAHGVYKVRQPRIDLQRLSAIRALISTPLVLHGGSGVPADLMSHAIHMPEGGVSKVNIATDLELATLQALQRDQFLSHSEFIDLAADQIELARKAVYLITLDKITNFLHSNDRSNNNNGHRGRLR
jgi:ketose-bisphosphate aldolase